MTPPITAIWICPACKVKFKAETTKVDGREGKRCPQDSCGAWFVIPHLRRYRKTGELPQKRGIRGLFKPAQEQVGIKTPAFKITIHEPATAPPMPLKYSPEWLDLPPKEKEEIPETKKEVTPSVLSQIKTLKTAGFERKSEQATLALQWWVDSFDNLLLAFPEGTAIHRLLHPLFKNIHTISTQIVYGHIKASKFPKPAANSKNRDFFNRG